MKLKISSLKVAPKVGLKVAPRTVRQDSAVDDDGADESPKSSSNGWLTQGQQNIRSMLDRSKAESARKFPPEFWLRSGEEGCLRFRSSEPIGSFYVYKLKSGGRYLRITAPPSGERDLFREAGKRASAVFLYEVIDRKGYTDKKTGKLKKDNPRFFAVNTRLYEQLEAIRAKKGSLTKFDIDIQKTGQDVNTSYVLIPGDTEPMIGIEKIPRIAGDAPKYYSPPSLEEARGILGNLDPEQAR